MKTFFLRLCPIAIAAAWIIACGSEGATPPAPQQPQLPAAPAAQPAAQGYPQPAAQPAQAAQPQPGTQPAQPAQPGQAAQNPMAGLVGALGAMQGQQNAAGGAPAKAIPWQSLVQALPVNTPGWTLDGEAKGESAAFGGFTTSNAKCRLKQGTLTAKVEIIDTTLNPMLAMPFNMARAVRVDSSEERMGPINFGTHPGTQSYKKKQNRAESMVMVGNRILINVEVKGATSEAQAVGVMQYVNFAHLAKLAGS